MIVVINCLTITEINAENYASNSLKNGTKLNSNGQDSIWDLIVKLISVFEDGSHILMAYTHNLPCETVIAKSICLDIHIKKIIFNIPMINKLSTSFVRCEYDFETYMERDVILVSSLITKNKGHCPIFIFKETIIDSKIIATHIHIGYKELKKVNYISMLFIQDAYELCRSEWKCNLTTVFEDISKKIETLNSKYKYHVLDYQNTFTDYLQCNETDFSNSMQCLEANINLNIVTRWWIDITEWCLLNRKADDCIYYEVSKVLATCFFSSGLIFLLIILIVNCIIYENKI